MLPGCISVVSNTFLWKQSHYFITSFIVFPPNSSVILILNVLQVLDSKLSKAGTTFMHLLHEVAIEVDLQLPLQI